MILYQGVEIYQTTEERERLRSELEKLTIEGDLAEVGVFQGGTAKVMKEVFPDRNLYLFDTFEGFADELHPSDPESYFIGDCAAPENIVRELMKNEKNVVIVKGVFPATADIIKKKKFAFVHIDVDIYNATKNSLEFFFPRMHPGGVIVVHDYPHHPGVEKAVDEFFADKQCVKEKGEFRQLIIRI